MKRKFLSVITSLVMAASVSLTFTGCNNKEAATKEGDKLTNKTITMATTTSTQDSGLLDYILPKFTAETGIDVKTVAVGTGQALKLGESGDADVLLVHAKAQEEEFVKAGHGLERFDVMYNDFILVGPKSDPGKIKESAGTDIAKALEDISKNQNKFISRGDESGTHSAEKKLWKGVNITPSGDWYLSAGQGMGAVLQLADEKSAYTISDRATYLSMKDKTELEIIVEGDSKLRNQYGVIAVNPNKSSNTNVEGAQSFIKWILSENVQKDIGEFGKDKFGQSLFFPNAK
ncbi:extracellular solute-binding protein [Clostridium sp.]|uniref:extracellular solute-binding protein n=1 Tax=Clostridium sp. TaxID=1506 RepID=UPI002FCC39EF